MLQSIIFLSIIHFITASCFESTLSLIPATPSAPFIKMRELDRRFNISVFFAHEHTKIKRRDALRFGLFRNQMGNGFRENDEIDLSQSPDNIFFDKKGLREIILIKNSDALLGKNISQLHELYYRACYLQSPDIIEIIKDAIVKKLETNSSIDVDSNEILAPDRDEFKSYCVTSQADMSMLITGNLSKIKLPPVCIKNSLQEVVDFNKVTNLVLDKVNISTLKNLATITKHFKMLESLTLSGNHIRDIADLHRLVSLDVFEMHNGIIQSSPYLKELDLSHNDIPSCNYKTIFNLFPKLRKLNLAYNNIHEISLDQWRCMPDGCELRLEGNPVTHIGQANRSYFTPAINCTVYMDKQFVPVRTFLKNLTIHDPLTPQEVYIAEILDFFHRPVVPQAHAIAIGIHLIPTIHYLVKKCFDRKGDVVYDFSSLTNLFLHLGFSVFPRHILVPLVTPYRIDPINQNKLYVRNRDNEFTEIITPHQ